jgi:large repetitive protein
LTSSTISGNTAGGSGGGISNSGTLTLSDDTISGNKTGTLGGGIYNTATLIVSDTTVSGNTAVAASGGGGIDNTGSGTATLANSVLSGNTSNGAPEDFDGVAYTDNGGNIVGVANGVAVSASAIDLGPLGSYGGPTQTLIPLPGSTAICAGLAAEIPSGLTTDQRGLPNTNASYPSYAACVDAGAVQTNYALSFTTQPTGVSVATNFAAAVTLTESGSPFQPGVTIPLTLIGSGTLTGGSATTSAGLASYTLQVDTAASSDQLAVNLALNSLLVPTVAISATSNPFGVGLTTPTVALSLSSNSISYGTLETFTATLTSAATGTVNFYNNGSTLLGTGAVSSGVATFSSSTLAAGSYSITASYSGDSNYNPNTSSALSLTVYLPPAIMTSPSFGHHVDLGIDHLHLERTLTL